MPQANMKAQMQAQPVPADLSASDDDLIYRITHDLSASMRSLVQLSSWIAEDVAAAGLALPSETESHISLLRSRGTHLQNMMKDLLAYAHIGQGGRAFCGDWTSLLRHVQRDVAELDQYRLSDSLKATPQIGRADLQTLLTVLLSNAVKHHDRPDGCITISAMVVGADVQINVVDDGPGIPAQQRDYLCKPWTSLEPQDGIESRGMGLAIAKKIAGVYGGHLLISDVTQGGGCHVVVTLPERIN